MTPQAQKCGEQIEGIQVIVDNEYTHGKLPGFGTYRSCLTKRTATALTPPRSICKKPAPRNRCLAPGAGAEGALAEVSLPAREIPLALLAFNAWSAAAPAYALGTLAAFWLFERLAGL